MSTAVIIILSLVAVFAAYIVISFRKYKNKDIPASEKIRILDDKNFQHQLKSGVYLVDFWAAWCVPCKMMTPVLNELADEMDGKVTICKLDVDKNQQQAVKYAVRSIPTLILFKDGKEIDRFVGVKSKDYLLKKVEEKA